MLLAFMWRGVCHITSTAIHDYFKLEESKENVSVRPGYWLNIYYRPRM